MQIEVNEASPQQANKIGRFIIEAWREAGPKALGWTGATEEKILDISSEKFLAGLLSSPDTKMFICEDKRRKIVGFALNKKISESDVELAGIIVLQDSLGRGIGTALIKRAIGSAISLHFHRMLVKTEADNKRAISFYKAKGFAEVGKKVESVQGSEVELVHLELQLN
jgi:L-amino acid N-acyltransferase YncA